MNGARPKTAGAVGAREGFRSGTESAIVATAGAALGLSFVLTPGGAVSGAVLCPFRLVTGLPCPGCGLGHSFVALAHGDPGGSFLSHPFGPLAFFLCAAVVALRLAERIAGRSIVGEAFLRRLRSPAIAIVAGWLAWAAVRLCSFSAVDCAA